MTVVVIDNYDSFTYNLVQYLQELGARTRVYRNDAISLAALKKIRFDKIVISPGPGRPSDAGISCALINELYATVPILGVCLGHQCIGECFGGRIIKAKNIMHGKTSLIYHNGRALFKGLKNPFSATRYHSLVVDSNHVPDRFMITARADDGAIMGITLRGYPLHGVQFHPESILTEEGKKILQNFLNV